MGRSIVVATVIAASVCVYGTFAGQAFAVDTISPAPATTPSPLKSGGSLAPVLPPEGLPTAPPPDAIKPVVPQARRPSNPEAREHHPAVPQARIDEERHGLEPAAARLDGGGS